MLFNNSFPNTYEEIKTWNPVWYRKVSDMDALWQVYGRQMDKIQENLIQLVNNNFIDFADEATIIRLEEFLSIKHSFPRTLVERRNIIKGFIIGQGHIGRNSIIELISIFTSGKINVAFSNGVITISVTRDFEDMFNLSDINLIIGDRIPAHLALRLVDLPRPVKVINKNSFSFINLLMFRFSVTNKTAIIIGSKLNGKRLLDGNWLLTTTSHGINFNNLHIKLRLQNYGEIFYGQRLNGKIQLDGLFMLNSLPQRILRGITSRKVDIKGFKFNNHFTIKLNNYYSLKVKNHNHPLVNSFNIHGRFINGTKFNKDIIQGLESPFYGLRIHNVNMGSYKYKNENFLSATIVRKGSWYLNGEFDLNGTNTIDKYIIKEAI